ncbi:MAG: deoxyribodipyrimidine photo-lyase [Planctomycetes bacterium]|nr:deoxyribodipyrimidine photo-lyase [Planctomycetota bacterium]
MAELRELAKDWRDALPDSLVERIAALGTAGSTPARATHVIYWMRAAPRGHENPALDAAIAAAEHLGLPTYVFHGLSPQPLLASPRRLDFALDAARDVSNELAARGIPYAVHVVRRGDKARPLASLLRGAALLVTELARSSPSAAGSRRSRRRAPRSGASMPRAWFRSHTRRVHRSRSTAIESRRAKSASRACCGRGAISRRARRSPRRAGPSSRRI